MAAVEVLQRINTEVPGMHVAVIQADDAETYQVPFKVYGAMFQPNRDNAAADSWGVTFTRGSTQVTINLVGTVTNVDGTLYAWGV